MYAQDNNPLPVWSIFCHQLTNPYLHQFSTIFGGNCIMVDQLESNTPFLIAQLKDKLTQQHYKYATVFVDQFSGDTFVYLQKRLTSDETVMAKHAFERSVKQRGVRIIHYHADNGRFADNAFIADCKAQRQGLSYCGVNTHFQNGITE